MTEHARQAKKLGFSHGDHVYLSDSFETLKVKVLELGAHRTNGEEGTGLDLRHVIQRVNPAALIALAINYALVDLDNFRPTSELLADAHADVDWKEHEDGIESARALAREHNDLVEAQRATDAAKFDPPLTPALKWASDHQAARSAEEREVGEAEQKADDEAWARIVATANAILEEKGHAPVIYETSTDPISPIQELLNDVFARTAKLAEEYPVTGSDAAGLAHEYADNGDVDALRELLEILKLEDEDPTANGPALDALLYPFTPTPETEAKRWRPSWRTDTSWANRRPTEVAQVADAIGDAEALWIGAATEALTPRVLTDSARNLCLSAGVLADPEPLTTLEVIEAANKYHADRETVIGRTSEGEELTVETLKATRGTDEANPASRRYAAGDVLRTTKLWTDAIVTVTEVYFDTVEDRQSIYVRENGGQGRTGLFYEDEVELYVEEPKDVLPSFSFTTSLENDSIRARWVDRILRAVVDEDRTIVLSRALNPTVTNAVYAVDQGWDDEEEEA